MIDAAVAEPPGDGVIVLGVDTQIGLAVVRELGEQGVPVYGIGRSRRAVGLYSRYLTEGFVHGPRDDRLIELIREIGISRRAGFVMTVSEGDILFLDRHRKALTPVRALVPESEAIRFVIDKARVYALAECLGLRVPQNHSVAADGTIADMERLRYPVILKWADPNAIMPLLREHGLPLRKAEYRNSPQELEAALTRYRPLGRYPLVQSYCPGHGLGQMLFMQRGEPVLKFQHRRLHEWPPEGGYSTLCESLHADRYPELMNQSVRLLREIDWEGPAMVEYRLDPRTGEAVLMEVNGRFWGSLPLAWHAGARFAWLLYRLIGQGKPVEDAGSYRAGVRCKFVIPDAKRLFLIVFRSKTIKDRTLRFNPWHEVLGFCVYFLKPNNRYYVFTWRDPMPFVRDVGFSLLRLMNRRGT